MNHNIIEAGTRLKIAAAGLALILFGGAACTSIESGSKVYLDKDIRGSYPYSVSVYANPCTVKAGEHLVDNVDPDFNIIEIDRCWINANAAGIKTKPTPTRTTYPTPNVWVPATPPGLNP